MKVLPCVDGNFYEDRTAVPKPINICTDGYKNIYCGGTQPFHLIDGFQRHVVHTKYSLSMSYC